MSKVPVLKVLSAIALLTCVSAAHASDASKQQSNSVKSPGYIGGPGSSYVKEVAQYRDRDDDRGDKREKEREKEHEKEHDHRPNPSRS